ncbi:transcriptional regulator, TetR family [Tistlia consotensis]|uniref:Transcriptional regulator, TetR family n=1 Tax=Tistlia consotensis USBA 355 TaxID=560819 RepID=A0A1Y6CWR7_9PROT|nr:TetR/AcrR family transcriptional regulator [Tistlia consotensis]SMF84005.1 transcriptional regulator, TetR family [Tistlia consotensis USBA 355]SNS34919.1 transcriptional regulator, TetR family [Tistlia consotensis]
MPWEKTFDVQETLEKAMNAFWARGYEATSVQDLVESTGLNRGSLYATYGDKHALFLAALRRYDRWLREELLQRIEADHGPRDAVRRLLLLFRAETARPGGSSGCFLTNTALELAPHDPQVRGVVATAQTAMEQWFARMISKGQAAGEIPEHVRPSEAARGLLATLIGLAVLARSRPEPPLVDDIVEDAMRRLE